MSYDQARFIAAKDNAATVATQALATIKRVVRIPLKKGWRYEAELADGSRQVIRATSTTCYDGAHLYADMVCSGKTGLGSVFSFTTGFLPPSRSWGPKRLTTFVIEGGA